MKRATCLALLLSLGVLAGCAEHQYRTYDPYYSDYHTWGPGEDGYYRQWYGETYHDRGYRDYRHLDHNEQHRYWEWRHHHGDRDHDRH